MFAAGNDLVSLMEEFAPSARALPGDVTGLQWGDLQRRVPAVLLALDFSAGVLEEALQSGAPFVITHHPFLYSPLKSLDLSRGRDALVVRALKDDITLYCAHTNLDVASRGVSDALGWKLGLREMQPLHTVGSEQFLKLVVFVPEGYEGQVRDALADAGAGWIGNYSHCTYQLLGTGTFMPREGSSPFIGATGELEKAREYRLETILPLDRREEVLKALISAHPYEEVAYDLYTLANEGESWGLGRVGMLEKPLPLQELARMCREMLEAPCLKFFGDPKAVVQKVAVMGGSGGTYLENALQSGAQVLVTGDVRFHEAQQAAERGLYLVDAGHEETERPIIPVLGEYLKKRIAEQGYETKVILSGQKSVLWRIPDR